MAVKGTGFLSAIWRTKGLARYMFWAGVLITAVFVFCGLFAPWVAPYGFAQTSANGVDFPKLAPPSSLHWLGTNDQFYDILSRMIWGARTALEVVVASVIMSARDRRAAGSGLGLHRRVDRQGARLHHGRAVRVPLVAARDRVLLPAQGQVRQRDHLGGRVAHRHLHPAVLPGRAQHHGLGAGVDVHRGGPRSRCTAVHHHAQVPLRQRRAVGAGARDPQRRGRTQHPGRPRLPGTRASSPPRRRSGATTSAGRSTTPRPATGTRRSGPA